MKSIHQVNKIFIITFEGPNCFRKLLEYLILKCLEIIITNARLFGSSLILLLVLVSIWVEWLDDHVIVVGGWLDGGHGWIRVFVRFRADFVDAAAIVLGLLGDLVIRQ